MIRVPAQSALTWPTDRVSVRVRVRVSVSVRVRVRPEVANRQGVAIPADDAHGRRDMHVVLHDKLHAAIDECVDGDVLPEDELRLLLQQRVRRNVDVILLSLAERCQQV